MNTRPTSIHRFVLPLILAAGSLACSFGVQLPGGSTPLPTPPNVTVVPAPSATAVGYPRVQIGFYTSLYLRYDPAVWQAGPRLGGGGQPFTSPQTGEVQLLSHRQFACEVHDNLGHGIENVQLSTYEKQVGSLTYRVDQWVSTENGNIVLVVYQYPAGDEQNAAHRIELEVKDANGEQCLQALEDALLLSTEEIQ